MNYNYDRQKLQLRLNALIEEEITGVFYFPNNKSAYYSDLRTAHYEYCHEWSFFLQTGTDKWYLIYETDYSLGERHLGLDLKIFESGEIPNLELGENQINLNEWTRYRHSRIETVEIYEDQYDGYCTPVGIAFNFSNNSRLYILNLTIEFFDNLKEGLEYSRDSGMLIAFSETNFLKLNIQKLNKL